MINYIKYNDFFLKYTQINKKLIIEHAFIKNNPKNTLGKNRVKRKKININIFSRL